MIIIIIIIIIIITKFYFKNINEERTLFVTLKSKSRKSERVNVVERNLRAPPVLGICR